jgi:M6 family metalloprotease-like protein
MCLSPGTKYFAFVCDRGVLLFISRTALVVVAATHFSFDPITTRSQWRLICMRLLNGLCISVLLLCTNQLVYADMPSKQGRLPDAYYQKLKHKPDAFRFQHAFLKTVARIQVNRQLAASLGFVTSQQIPGGLAIAGDKTVHVIPILFSDTSKEPYPKGQLQKELFESWPSGTMGDFYNEISYGRLHVTGSVFPWRAVSKTNSHYVGPDYQDETGKTQHCYGLCPQSNIGELLNEALDSHPEIDWAPTDNDGPDGKPNSGDDDGFVDFVAFVHPGKGGECGDNQNIWSHRGRLSDWIGHEYTTKTDRKGGGKLKIDDYVIMPAIACDGSTMIQIGVFAHEFGHAFGLPDLYDTSRDPQWDGMGNWDLMAAGGWGGDDNSPESPTHMGAWSKEFLGWVNPIDVESDTPNVKIKDWETSGTVYRMRISPSQYYLITNRQPRLFDSKLPGGGGLLIEYVNEKKVQAGLTSNTVNNDVNNKGVAIVEADGVAHLNDLNAATRSNAGDIFPGSSGAKQFDSDSSAKPSGSNAVCGISKDGSTSLVAASFQKSSQKCPAVTSANSERTVPMVSLASINESPSKYLNEPIRVEGQLTTEGENYFTDMAPVLVDEHGDRLLVQIPRALEVDVGNRDAHPPPRPQQLSDLLGKRVEIRGRLGRMDFRKRANVVVLRAESVRLID